MNGTDVASSLANSFACFTSVVYGVLTQDFLAVLSTGYSEDVTRPAAGRGVRERGGNKGETERKNKNKKTRKTLSRRAVTMPIPWALDITPPHVFCAKQCFTQSNRSLSERFESRLPGEESCYPIFRNLKIIFTAYPPRHHVTTRKNDEALCGRVRRQRESSYLVVLIEIRCGLGLMSKKRTNLYFKDRS